MNRQVHGTCTLVGQKFVRHVTLVPGFSHQKIRSRGEQTSSRRDTTGKSPYEVVFKQQMAPVNRIPAESQANAELQEVFCNGKIV